jgi:hypothetical protein
VPFGEIGVLDECGQAWAILLLVVNSVLMSQQYILNKVSLNWNVHKEGGVLSNW